MECKKENPFLVENYYRNEYSYMTMNLEDDLYKEINQRLKMALGHTKFFTFSIDDYEEDDFTIENHPDEEPTLILHYTVILLNFSLCTYLEFGLTPVFIDIVLTQEEYRKLRYNYLEMDSDQENYEYYKEYLREEELVTHYYED